MYIYIYTHIHTYMYMYGHNDRGAEAEPPREEAHDIENNTFVFREFRRRR